ncbi:HMG-Y-related protein A-like [Apium graveolens]|uniref:HMG-Y-related protein A-like n=1 Tax=Apium graveolens TaxID=4045 RepID=UPI003D7BC1C5
MATEEVSKPPSLPPYPQMIMAAMDALKDNEGLSKASISKYMEATYGDLPAGHANLLTQHLNTMKQKGELVLVKNNYMKPGPDVPVKRGRGRPPKPKAEDGVAHDGPGKPRGRVRKENDGHTEQVAKKVKSDDEGKSTGKPRGRPRKIVEGQVPRKEGVEAN